VRTGLAAAALLGALACAPGCRTQGPLPQDWGDALRIESEHFVIETDVAETRAADLLHAAEATYADLRSRFELQDDPASGGAIRLLVFEDQADYGSFHGAPLPSKRRLERERRELEEDGWIVSGPLIEAGQGHLTSGPRGEDALLALSLAANTESVLAHELAHYFIACKHGPLPAWLDEGLAESMRHEIDPAARSAGVDEFRELVVGGEAVPLPRLLELDHADFVRLKNPAYRTAWALVRHLRATGAIHSPADLGFYAAAAAEAAASLSLSDLALKAH